MGEPGNGNPNESKTMNNPTFSTRINHNDISALTRRCNLPWETVDAVWAAESQYQLVRVEADATGFELTINDEVVYKATGKAAYKYLATICN